MGCPKVERPPKHVKTVSMQVNKDFVPQKFPEYHSFGNVYLILQVGGLVAECH